MRVPPARFTLDATEDGRLCLGVASLRTALGSTGYAHEVKPSPMGCEFRRQMGEAVGDQAAVFSFRVGERVFRVCVASEVIPVDESGGE